MWLDKGLSRAKPQRACINSIFKNAGTWKSLARTVYPREMLRICSWYDIIQGVCMNLYSYLRLPSKVLPLEAGGQFRVFNFAIYYYGKIILR